MIRMGRSTIPAKPESVPPQTENASFDLTKTNQPFGFQTNDSAPLRFGENSQNRAFTDSEAMARDIKEGRLSGYVGSGTMLTGETEFQSMLRVDGHLVGKITSADGTLHVGASGVIDANIFVGAAIVHGTINGDIVAKDKIELGRTAKVIGNIQTPSLMMETGAILEGNCSMLKQKADADKRAVQNVIETVKEQSAKSESATIAEKAATPAAL
jgi:cytoskeletal protein CcmA (bactofilin family)